jgi:hypothetical protein
MDATDISSPRTPTYSIKQQQFEYCTPPNEAFAIRSAKVGDQIVHGHEVGAKPD